MFHLVLTLFVKDLIWPVCFSGNGNIGGEYGDGGRDRGRGYARGRGRGRGRGFRGRGRGGYGGPVDVQHDAGGYNDEAPFQAQGREPLSLYLL